MNCYLLDKGDENSIRRQFNHIEVVWFHCMLTIWMFNKSITIGIDPTTRLSTATVFHANYNKHILIRWNEVDSYNMTYLSIHATNKIMDLLKYILESE